MVYCYDIILFKIFYFVLNFLTILEELNEEGKLVIFEKPHHDEADFILKDLSSNSKATSTSL